MFRLFVLVNVNQTILVRIRPAMPKLLQLIRHGCFKHCRYLSQSSLNIFDNKIKRIQRDRALASPDSHLYDYLREEVAFRVADRVFDIKR